MPRDAPGRPSLSFQCFFTNSSMPLEKPSLVLIGLGVIKVRFSTRLALPVTALDNQIIRLALGGPIGLYYKKITSDGQNVLFL